MESSFTNLTTFLNKCRYKAENEEDKNKWKISTNIYTNGKAEEISLEVNSLLAQQ